MLIEKKLWLLCMITQVPFRVFWVHDNKDNYDDDDIGEEIVW